MDLFDDCDDDLLLQAVDEADRTLSNSIISVNDSEDEDMFNDERDDDDDVFAEVVTDDGPLLTKPPSKNDSLDQVKRKDRMEKFTFQGWYKFSNCFSHCNL